MKKINNLISSSFFIKKKSLQDCLKSARELYAWNKRVLSIGGMWPLEQTFVKFYIGYIYFIIHVILAAADFISVFGNLTLMIANLSETSVQAMVGVKMMVLRHSKPLEKVMRHVAAGAKKRNYRNQEEIDLYLAYNTIGRMFFKIGGCLSFVTVFFYHFKPFEDILKAGKKENFQFFNKGNFF